MPLAGVGVAAHGANPLRRPVLAVVLHISGSAKSAVLDMAVVKMCLMSLICLKLMVLMSGGM